MQCKIVKHAAEKESKDLGYLVTSDGIDIVHLFL